MFGELDDPVTCRRTGMAQPLVTVGICTKNSEETVGSTMESIAGQHFPKNDIEIVIVDGSSTDNTLGITRDFLSRSSMKNRVFDDNHRGLGAARQMVVDHASGEFIVWVDSDVVLARDFLRKQVDFLIENRNVAICRGKGEYCGWGSNLQETQNLFFSVMEVVYFGATISRVKALKDVGGFDSHIKGAAEDVDIVTRLRYRGWRVSMNYEARFYHAPKETLSSLYRQSLWFGYGDHYIGHKYPALIKIPYRLPPVFFAYGFKISLKAYHQYRKKKSFLIPFLCLFKSLGWSIGFLKGHLNGYGHSFRESKLMKSCELRLEQSGSVNRASKQAVLLIPARSVGVSYL